MTYRVEYNHKSSGLICVEAGIELKEDAQILARRTLDIEGATFARVIDEDSEGEVWSVRAEGDGTTKQG